MYSEGLKWCLALQLLLPYCFLETSIQGQSADPKFALSGSNVSLRSSNLPENYHRLGWFYNTDLKILEWETNQPNPHYFETKFKDRVTLGRQDGALHIYNVQEEDSSTYILKVLLNSRFEEERRIPLKVLGPAGPAYLQEEEKEIRNSDLFRGPELSHSVRGGSFGDQDVSKCKWNGESGKRVDPVPKPDITIEKTQEMNNSCYLILSCTARNQFVNYTWYGDSGRISEELQSGVLNITVIPQNYSKFYKCEVSNPVSHNSDTVYFISPCKLARSSGVAWIPAWLMVMVPTILGLLLI
ncbi:CD48 antigen [Myotis brandtii]|uniref:CD48 antigen n=1 Tax=Myotis brandtii TaxID=109478 RepID=S7NXS7_MYOBR|nr:CD48 antigen [Myotis brandtii]